MEEDVERSLRTLLDVEGVEGSFLFDSDGELLAWDMPSSVEERGLEEASRKLAGLRTAFLECGDAIDFVSLHYGEHRLCLKKGTRATLCVLAHSEVNLATLRMATRLTLRRLEPHGGA